jgi:hypothetical protein
MVKHIVPERGSGRLKHKIAISKKSKHPLTEAERIAIIALIEQKMAQPVEVVVDEGNSENAEDVIEVKASFLSAFLPTLPDEIKQALPHYYFVCERDLIKRMT